MVDVTRSVSTLKDLGIAAALMDLSSWKIE